MKWRGSLGNTGLKEGVMLLRGIMSLLVLVLRLSCSGRVLVGYGTLSLLEGITFWFPFWFSLGLAVCLSVCLFVCLSVCLFVCLSVCLFVCVSICLFFGWLFEPYKAC
ncbi:hypothetical protein BO99DRAFT_224576 [Aspergillus violaceofuscus CBS 115571]|uniref:Uncharacterized protein n=1 Tax=Aspergillus violaceofuscus (strain CBS 115571) TaxID=1450538 RepID=A0A2V5HNN5_ASPV1|nr:hypothetical protein BO99DRAFT_224576 [Aspergillus violaceofuscus CBS 115571]